MKKTVRLFMLVVAIAMVIGMMSISAYAAGSGTEADPWTMNNVTAYIKDDVLHIGGSGSTGLGWNGKPWASSKYTAVSIDGTNIEIDPNSFNGNSKLQTISGSGTVSKIGQSAFAGSGVQTININGSNLVLDYGVAQNCTSLTSVTLNGSVSQIGSQAFSYCTSLSTVNVAGSGLNVKDQAFRGCTNLKNVNFTGTVSYLDAAVLDGGPSDVTISFTQTTPPGVNYSMPEYSQPDAKKAKITVIVPAEGLENYQNDSEWKKYGVKANEPAHTHEFEEGWTSDANKHWHAATCGHDVKSGEAAHNLNAQGTIKSEATCTDPAVYYKKCSVCGYESTETMTVGSAKGHSYATDWTSDAAKHWHAATCGHNVTSGEASHNLTEQGTIASAASCTEPAKYYKKCSVCGYQSTETMSVGEALGHNFATTWTSDANNHWHAATCGHDVKDQEQSHDLRKPGTLISEPTCTEPAKYYAACYVCGYESKQIMNVGSATGHSFATTWTAGETTHWHAATCGHDVKSGETAHSLTEQGSLASAASCTEPAKYYKKCSVCGYESKTETMSVGEALGHTFATTWTKDANTHWHAATCGHDVKDQEQSHDLRKPGTVISEPSCTEPGKCYAACYVCGYESKQIMNVGSATGHSFATTWTAGETTHWHAATCGHDVKSGETAHSLTEQGSLASAASCTEPAKYYKKCSVCGYESKTETMSVGTATGHSFATTWTAGETTHWHAATCGHDVKADETAHVYDQQGDIVSYATCTQPEIHKMACVCGAQSPTETMEVGTATGHKLMYAAEKNTIEEFCMYCDDISRVAELKLDPSVSLVYNGSEICPAYVDYPEGWEGGELTVTYESNINAGTAMAKASKEVEDLPRPVLLAATDDVMPLADTSTAIEATLDFEIEPKSITVTITPNGGQVGSVKPAAAELDASALCGTDDPAVTLTYEGTTLTGAKVGPTESAPQKAGNYTVTATISDPNYVLTGTNTAAFVVSRKPSSNPYTGDETMTALWAVMCALSSGTLAAAGVVGKKKYGKK